MKIESGLIPNASQGLNIPKEANQTNKGMNKDIHNSQRSKEVMEIGRKQLSEEKLIATIEHANKSVKVYDRKLEFSIHEKTKQIMVKVVDTSGGKEQVIREIPSEKVLDMVAKLCEMAGILIDEKA